MKFSPAEVWAKSRRFALWFLGIISGILLILTVLAWVFEDKVQAVLIARLNEELNTRVEIGRIDFSLIRNFPDASLSISDVIAHHSTPYKGAGQLLVAQRIAFRFSLFDLFSGNYGIKRIDLENGAISILRDGNGNINYNLLKPSEGRTQEDNGFRLNKLSARNIQVIYNDALTDISTGFLMNSGLISGDFQSGQYDLSTDAELQMQSFIANGVNWIENRPVNCEFVMHVDRDKGIFEFKKAELLVSNLAMSVSGKYYDTENPRIDVSLKGKDLDIRSMLSLLPPKYEDKIREYSSSGIFYCDAQITGETGAGKLPKLSGSFGIRNGTIKQKKSGISLSDVNIDGWFESDKTHPVLDLKQLSFSMRGGKVSGSCMIKGFEKPYVRLNAEAGLDLAEVREFIAPEHVPSMSGTARLKIQLTGSAESLKSGNGRPNYTASGSLNISKGAFNLKNDTMHYSGVNGSFRFNNNSLIIEHFEGLAGRSDFTVSGRLDNVFDYIFSESGVLTVNAGISSKLVFLDELFQRKAATAAENVYRFEISPRLNLKVAARVNQLQFRKFTAGMIAGDFTVNERMLRAEHLSFQTMKGRVNMRGVIDGTRQQQLRFSCNAELKQVDIQQLFFECENFGQTVMKDENIRGKVDADIVLSALSDNTLQIDPASVTCKSRLVISKGELIQFEPLTVLGRFVSLDELKQVKFSELRNEIEIKNSVVIIPLMDVTSSAMNISVSGRHGFDNNIDYRVRLLLSEVLSGKAKRAKKENAEFGVEVDDGLGRTSLFLSMKGPIDNPKIAYDGKGAREKMKNDMAKEKQNLKQTLHEEFGWFKKDTSVVKKKNIPPQKKSQKILVEFDED